MMRRFLMTTLLVAGVAVGCDNSGGTTATASGGGGAAKASPADALPGNLRLAAAPTDAKDVVSLKSSVKDGDHVIVRGVVAGRADPIAENRAILTLLDGGIRTCDKMPSDECKTPWDACCEPADVLAKNSVTVQVVDAQGRPMKASLASVEGVKPLAHLVVSGTAKVGADGAVLVNADGVHVVQ